MHSVSRRDFIKLGTAALGGLAFRPFSPAFIQFDDASLVRVTTNSVSVYSEPNDKSRIVAQWFRDELIAIYAEVNAGAPVYNPIWYRVWGGYVHRGRLQKVKNLFNEPLPSLPKGTRQLAEITVPFTQAMRFTKTTAGNRTCAFITNRCIGLTGSMKVRTIHPGTGYSMNW